MRGGDVGQVMSAEDDYAEAERLVSRAIENNATRLSLNELTDLETLPDTISRISTLEELELGGTRITDVERIKHLPRLKTLRLNGSPVANAKPLFETPGLETLNLSGTQVEQIPNFRKSQKPSGLLNLSLADTPLWDVTQLQFLLSLETLNLSNTEVEDIGSLRALYNLQALDLTGSKVSDLRAIAKVKFDRVGGERRRGLHFAGTPAAISTPELAELSRIEDDAERTAETLAYLKTLPPWPKTWERGQAMAGANAEPDLPKQQPAPVEVVIHDDRIGLSAAHHAADSAVELRARQGWTALQDFLDDLEDQRPRIGNSMPRLAKALDRLAAALGEDYDNVNAIALGTHGDRVIRQSAEAREVLMEEDAADVEAFAASLALLLERFPEWLAYKADAVSAIPTVEETEALAQEVEQALGDLDEEPFVSPDVTLAMEDIMAFAQEAPDDPVAAKGLRASAANVISAMGAMALTGARWMRNQGLDLARMSVEETKQAIAKSVGAAVSVTAVGYFTLKAAEFAGLASRMATEWPWLAPLLRALGITI